MFTKRAYAAVTRSTLTRVTLQFASNTLAIVEHDAIGESQKKAHDKIKAMVVIEGPHF